MPSQVVSRAFVAMILLVLAPVAALAQASIAGVVRDASGAVLPGVTVEAASPALIEKTRSVVTSGDGQYRIVDLRPGTYTVTFTLSGFNTVRREGLELSGSLTATVDADMRVGGVEETITVTGATPLVDVQSTQQQRVLNKEIIDMLPTGRTSINVAVLIPGMQLSTTFSGEGQDVGGSTGEVQQTLSIHGSRGGDMRRMVDGLSMQSQGTSVSAFAANSGMIQEVTVDTAAGSAEQSAGGVRMNIIPREGGNTFSGSFFVTGTSDDLQSDNSSQELRDRGLVSASSVKSNWEVNPAFGGPLKSARIRLVGTDPGRPWRASDHERDIHRRDRHVVLLSALIAAACLGAVASGHPHRIPRAAPTSRDPIAASVPCEIAKIGITTASSRFRSLSLFSR
jgi:hypothetical protein